MCAIGLSVYELRRLQKFQGDVTVAQTKITDVNRVIREYTALPAANQSATADKSPYEQNQFMDSLRKLQTDSHVQFTRLANLEAAAPAATDPNAPAAPKSSVTATPISCVIEATGKQNDIRQFLYRVQRSVRLMNMSDVRWLRDQYPNTHLVFTLTRYVSPPGSHPVIPAATAQGEPTEQGTVISASQRTTSNAPDSSETRAFLPGGRRPANSSTIDLPDKVNHLLGMSGKSSHGGASSATPSKVH